MRFLTAIFLIGGFALAQSPFARIEGTIYDSERLPIAGATIKLPQLKRGAVTRSDGSFVIANIPPGVYQVEVSAVGYEPTTTTVQLAAGKTERLRIVLRQSSIQAQSVEVTATRRIQEQTDTRTSVLTVDPREAKYKAGGIEDVFRTLQNLPGVTAPSDFSSQLVIRGSGPDQNLILLDNIELFNPYRLYGFISLFNPETINSITLLTGGFGAQYSDRLSAVLDVRNRDGYTGNGYFAGKLNVSITNANVITEGALPFWNGAWLLSTRRTYYDLIVGPIVRATGAVEGDVAFPNFRDLQLKLTLFPAQGHKLFANILTSRDNTEFRSGVNRQTADSLSLVDRSYNDAYGITWQWTPSQRFVANVGLSYYANYGANSFGGVGGSALLNNNPDGGPLKNADFKRLQDSLRQAGVDVPTLFSVRGETGFRFQKTSLKVDNIWQLDSLHTLEFGLQQDWLYTGVVAYLDFDPRLKALRDANPVAPPLPESVQDGIHYIRSGLYAQDRWRVLDRLTLTLGARFDYFALLDKAYVAPRMSLSYGLTPQTTLRASWGIYYQSPGYEKLFDQQVFLDLTGDNVRSLRAERAMHHIIGVEHQLGQEWIARVEGYYKGFRDLILPKVVQGTVWKVEKIPGLPDSVYRTRDGWTAPIATVGDSLTTIPVNSATGEAYGIELFLQKLPSAGYKGFYGWIAYSFAFANRYRDGLVIPFNFDRRHTLSIVAGWRISERLDVSATFTYGSGFPWTYPVGITPRIVKVRDTTTGQITAKIDTDWRGVVFNVDRGGLENINRGRLPDYHRLDVRVTTYTDWFGWKWSFYLDVINVYNRQNVVGIFYRVNRETLELIERRSTMLPILPTIGFSVTF
ncbi:MAG: TonB-dependent receptor [Bacteroidota bacterium]|nr:TonB-dependent receptor [Candidatus Kapabacteria bacterium]MCS7302804.1 TonB-dependent receptor [Candidatus Kapabacteria bacterium]MCX7937040.1 TonB-dependent receptor [Chlorobiota bacterium]MDW8075511.1 TonB-dependent receptor [Bacteroidota bacterium]MDW8272368.1 TonB-dependent receptor [Bacteroidota bacterium]